MLIYTLPDCSSKVLNPFILPCRVHGVRVSSLFPCQRGDWPFVVFASPPGACDGLCLIQCSALVITEVGLFSCLLATCESSTAFVCFTEFSVTVFISFFIIRKSSWHSMNVNPKFFSHLVFAFQSWSCFILLCLSEGKKYGIFFNPIPCLFLYGLGFPVMPRNAFPVHRRWFWQLVWESFWNEEGEGTGLLVWWGASVKGRGEEGLYQGREEALRGGMVDHGQGEGGVLASGPSS